jgi:hypothetical protein
MCCAFVWFKTTVVPLFLLSHTLAFPRAHSSATWRQLIIRRPSSWRRQLIYPDIPLVSSPNTLPDTAACSPLQIVLQRQQHVNQVCARHRNRLDTHAPSVQRFTPTVGLFNAPDGQQLSGIVGDVCNLERKPDSSRVLTPVSFRAPLSINLVFLYVW